MKNINNHLFCTAFALLLLSACASTIKTPSVVTERVFPSVKGSALSGNQVKIPEDFYGKPTLLLIGYKQRTQFDIDRWILGLLQADVKVQIVEVPTIAGMMPQMVQSFIDNGMRSGIPKEDWASVVTVYEEADKIIATIGNENPQNAQVVLLDATGKIQWFANAGYSAAQVLTIKSVIDSGLR
jgi:hypothetical protein